LIEYNDSKIISIDQFVDLLKRSLLSERRPIDDAECIGGMLQHADLVVTAWRKNLLVGVARSVTDFYYSCYLSDLAVDQSFQRAGVGRELIRRTRDRLGPRCAINLLSAPAATEYYPRIGFTRHDSAWVLYPKDHLI